MPKILNRLLKASFKIIVLMVLLTGTKVFGQHKPKTAPIAQPKTAEAPEYYEYKRTTDQYDGLSVKASLTKQADGQFNYKLNLIYTSTNKNIVQKIQFISSDDSNLHLTLALLPDGEKYIDNKTMSSNKYHVNLTDSDLVFLNKQPIGKILVMDENNSPIKTFDIISPSFLTEQFNLAQSALKPKPLNKKPVKKGTVKKR